MSYHILDREDYERLYKRIRDSTKEKNLLWSEEWQKSRTINTRTGSLDLIKKEKDNKRKGFIDVLVEEVEVVQNRSLSRRVTRDKTKC